MKRGARQVLFASGAAAAMLLLATLEAYAVTREQLNACRSSSDASPDQRISACSAVIDGTRNKKMKGGAYALRGKAYRAKGDHENSIS